MTSPPRRRQAPPSTNLTVLMPALNAGPYIGEAIESLLPQLRTGDILHIQDGGSSDDTAAIVASYASPQIRLVARHDRGQADALQAALALVETQYVGWLNADDKYFPGALQHFRDAVVRHHNPQVLFGEWCLYGADGEVFRRFAPQEFSLRSLYRKGQYVFSGATFFSRDIIERAGGFDAKYQYCMDYDLYCRVASLEPCAVPLPALIGGLRWHPGGKSGSEVWPFVRETFEIRREWLARANGCSWPALCSATAIHIAAALSVGLRHSHLYTKVFHRNEIDSAP